MAKKWGRLNKESISNQISILRSQLIDLVSDAVKFDKGNASAGIRVRLGLQKNIQVAKEIRGKILTRRKEREFEKLEKKIKC